MKFKTWMLSVLGVLLALSISACDDDDSSSKISLSSVVVNPTAVTIDSSNVGTITFNLAVVNPSESAVTAFGDYLANQTISLEVVHTDTTVSHPLTEGTLVTQAPAGPGQYAYTIDTEAQTAVVYFYNEIAGKTLIPGGTYHANITVLPNDYFATEAFQTMATIAM